MRWSYFAIILVVGLVSSTGTSTPGLAQSAQAADPTLRPQDRSRDGRQAAQALAPPLAIKEVKPGVYMVTGGRLGGNTTVRVTNQGLIVVDTKNRGEENYNALMAQIRSVSAAPVRYVFITHHHQDHSGNAGRFESGGADVFVHEGVNKALDTYRPPQGAPEKVQATFAVKQAVELGDASAEAIHIGSAHTGADALVYFPDVRVIATGDTVVANVPHIDYPFGGSAVGWLKVLDELLNWDFDVAVPGHGIEPMSKAEVRAFRDKLQTVVTRARELVKAGTPKGQLIASIKTDDLGWNINNQQWTNTERLDAFYREMGK